MDSHSKQEHVAPQRSAPARLLADYIVASTHLRAFGDVIWAVEHYKHHYEPDLDVEICVAIAFTAVGEADRGIGAIRHAQRLSVQPAQLAKRLRAILGCTIRPSANAAELQRQIAAHQQSRHGSRGRARR